MDIVIDIRSTLHLINSQSIKLGECQLTHMQLPKISWLLTDCWCWSSVKWVSTEVSMECWWRVDRVHQLTVDSKCLCTHDPYFTHASSKKSKTCFCVKPFVIHNCYVSLWLKTKKSWHIYRRGWPENTVPWSMDPPTDPVHGLLHGPVCRRVGKRGPWTGPWSSPWTGSVGGSTDRGSVFSGHPIEGLHLEKMKVFQA